MILEVLAVSALAALAAIIVVLARRPRTTPTFVWPPITGPGVSRPGFGEVSEGKPND